MRDLGRTIPPRNEVSRVGDASRSNRETYGDVAAAANRVRQLPIRPTGVFHHPADWTEEEVNVIVDCLKDNIPVYRIAKYVNCERHALARFIDKNPELRRLMEEQRDNLYDEAIFQADRLAKQGNASIIMFILERLGKSKGWAQQEVPEENGKDEGKIIMGAIPEADIEKAELECKKITGEENKVFEGDPVKLAKMQMEAAEEMAAEKAAAAAAAAQRKIDEVADGSVVEVEAEEEGAVEYDGDGFAGGYGGYGPDEMPPDDGGSMYFQ